MRYVVFALALLLYAVVAAAQDGHPDLSGVWLRNPEKGSRSASPPQEMRVRIVQSGAHITITIRTLNNGAEETNEESLQTDGRENANKIHGAPMTSTAIWEGSVLVVDSVAKFGDQNLRMHDLWSLAEDRQSITFVERHQFGAEPQATEETYVLDRQPDASWKPAGQPQAAEQAYPNIEILKGVPSSRIPVIMAAFSRALGVSCNHCHVEGAMEKGDKPQFGKARRMFQMRNWIAENQKLEVSCWTCHRGHAVPEPRPQIDDKAWPGALDLTPAQSRQPAASVYKNLKFFNSSAGDLKSAMLFMSDSLGVDCAYCHVPGSWEKDEKAAKGTARKMLAMVRDTRREFADIRIGCPTCHHGAIKPETTIPK